MTAGPKPTVTYTVSWIAAVVNGNPWGDYVYPRVAVPEPYYFGWDPRRGN